MLCTITTQISTGPKYVGPIHGRVLLASSAAALAGPSILLSLRSKSEMAAIEDLVAKVDPARFQQAFSASVEDVQALIEVWWRPIIVRCTLVDKRFL